MDCRRELTSGSLAEAIFLRKFGFVRYEFLRQFPGLRVLPKANPALDGIESGRAARYRNNMQCGQGSAIPSRSLSVVDRSSD